MRLKYFATVSKLSKLICEQYERSRDKRPHTDHRSATGGDLKNGESVY